MTPRQRMIAALTAELNAAVVVNDLEAVRIASDAIGRLLGAPGRAAPVADLAAERKKRSDR